MGSLCSKDLNPLMGFRKEFLKKNFHGGLLSVSFFWLVRGEVTGWCSRNLALSLKLSSFWLKALVPAELKDIVMDATWEGIGTLPQDCTTLDWSFPVFPLPSLISECLNLPSGTQRTQRRSGRLNEAYTQQTTGDKEETCPLDPQRVLLSFSSEYWEETALATFC